MKIKKIRRETYTLQNYLEDIVEENIRTDQDVQRMAGSSWDASMINELIFTALTNGYIPPLILGEETLEEGTQLWVIDGGQRSAYLSMFRYEGYKITKNIEEYIVEYQRNVLDGNGKPIKDEDGNIKKEFVSFDIRNKTYNDLPKEVKKVFDKYQIDVVTHQNCTMREISRLVRRYNNHKAMSSIQRNYTYLDNYAREINELSKKPFFKESSTYSLKERMGSTFQKIICDAIMTIYHLEHWNKNMKKANQYLNENADISEFKQLGEYLDRLGEIVDDDTEEIFTSKDTFVWLTVFHKFNALGLDDTRFDDFLHEYKNSLHLKEINGVSFDELSKYKGTRDTRFIKDKIHHIETLMYDFLGISCNNNEQFEEKNQMISEDVIKEINTNEVFDSCVEKIIDSDIIKAVSHTEKISKEVENYISAECLMIANNEIPHGTYEENQKFVDSEKYNVDLVEDVDFYLDILNDWSLEIDGDSKILNIKNIPALVGIVKYTCDMDNDNEGLEWFKIYGYRLGLSGNVSGDLELMKHSFHEFMKTQHKRIA